MTLHMYTMYEQMQPLTKQPKWVAPPPPTPPPPVPKFEEILVRRTLTFRKQKDALAT